MHETRAAALQVALDTANARIAHLEDELTIAREETQAAYAGQKPPVTIISDSPTTTTTVEAGAVSGDGDVLLPSANADKVAAKEAETRAAAAVVAGIVAVVAVVAWLVAKFRKRL